MLPHMSTSIQSPFLVFAVSLIAMWLAARIGLYFRRKNDLDEAGFHDFDVVVAATLTLLGLIIGFSFSMAISRYDQRKNYEEAEANAIGTEYVRAELLPAADAARVRGLLKDYLDQRILFYRTRDELQLRQVNTRTAQLQSEMWSAVRDPARAQPTPVLALTIAGMNDVLNSEGYTQAAWWNRIPTAAWCLMLAVAICSNLLVGYASRRIKQESLLMLVLPLVLSIAFYTIADIDSPRRGIIRVNPQNLESLHQGLNGQAAP
jgi:hypothetical protein